MSGILGRDTIFALSSGALPSGVAVIRVSGPEAAKCFSMLSGSLPKPRSAALRNLYAADGRLLDSALVLWFPAPASFTGEDCVEFQCHGGPAVVAALLKELARIEGFRLADAGEFSLRAFTNGKADLTRMEALADLIDAETESQRALAISQASGQLLTLYEGWRSQLLRARAYMEADLDFSDEDDVPGSVALASHSIVSNLMVELEAHLKTAGAAEMIRDGFRVVIAGAPNTGKSTLLNTLAKREVAIVTPIAGTTRDVLDIWLDVGGHKIVISDTAGLRSTDDQVEKIGIERAYSVIEMANLVLVLSDNKRTELVTETPVLHIKTKCDDGVEIQKEFDFGISCQTGRGLVALLAAIGDRARVAVGNYNEGTIVSRARHIALLENARAALVRFPTACTKGLEFGSEELRISSDALGRITGVISSEDVLGAIFSSFCIGK